MQCYFLIIFWLLFHFQVKKLAKQGRVFCKAYSKTNNFKGRILSTWDMAYLVENLCNFHYQRQNLNSSRYILISRVLFQTFSYAYGIFWIIFTSLFFLNFLWEYILISRIFIYSFRNLLLHYYMQLLTLAVTKMTGL